MTLDPMPDAATLLRMKAEREGRQSGDVRVVVKSYQLNPAPTSTVVARLLEPEPIRLRIPWSCLISDNALYVTRDGKRYKSPEYREAQKKIAQHATEVMDGRPLFACPLHIAFHFYVPNGQRRDVHNFIAGIADSLKGIVFTDDHLLHKGGWTHAGRDIDAPRCELTITPLNR